MPQHAFLIFCKKQGYSLKQIALFEKALDFAKDNLDDQQRLAGDSVFDHNVRVANILAENKSEPDIIITGILGSILKFSGSAKVAQHFGENIVELLRGVDDISLVKSKNVQLEADALRKILLTTLKDVRVIIVKLANKLDNLRTIDSLSLKEQKRIATEVLEVYAPLAYRLGWIHMKVQLEDAAFEVINPRKYNEICKFIEDSRSTREEAIAGAIAMIKKLASSHLKILEITGRPKHIYSIYKKIIQRGVSLDQQFDLLGIRIIVKDVKDCYSLLGLLHEKFEPVAGRLKDYIANPKANFYRSLHTGLRLPNGKIVEVQIRTEQMHEFAEEGIAAHWRYKGIKSNAMFEKKMSWLKGVLDLQKSGENKEMLETIKVDLFGDKIHCYTPKGDLKELPVGASILDFAYSVHEQVGNTAVGARVNGTFVPLKHVLKAGDIVEVVTNKNQRPRRSWIKLVVSSKSRQKIRKSLKEYDKIAPLHFRRVTPKATQEMGILVESPEFASALCSLAKCCHPLPAEKIVGIVTKRRVISTHRQDCRAAQKEKERWVPVIWRNSFSAPIHFIVEAHERSGLLADLLNTIARAGFTVREAKAKLFDIGFAQCMFSVVPRDLEHLQNLVLRVRKVKGVKRMYFE